MVLQGSLSSSNLMAGALPPLPEAVTSFGAAVVGHELYVYGGHVGKTHQHSIENLSRGFYRLDLADPATGWQDLGPVVGLQGLPLVAIGEEVCRIGGLSALNHQGDEEDLRSVAEVEGFSSSGGWRTLPPLPAPRSSHDAFVLDQRLYVVGGWELRGRGNEPRWHDTMAVLDLSVDEPVWCEVAQPFRRRALAVAVAGGKIHALGGIDEAGPSGRLDVFDPVNETWSQGEDLPIQSERMKGFGASAIGHDGKVFVSGADGVVHAYESAENRWSRDLAQLSTPRFFHRLLHYGDCLLFLGGAGRGGHLAELESVALTSVVR